MCHARHARDARHVCATLATLVMLVTYMPRSPRVSRSSRSQEDELTMELMEKAADEFSDRHHDRAYDATIRSLDATPRGAAVCAAALGLLCATTPT